MRWWVSRDAFEAVQADRDAWKALALDSVPRGTIDHLVVSLAQNLTTKTAPLAELPPSGQIVREKSPIEQRIEEISENDPTVKRWFWSQVGKWRREGHSDGDIVGMIRWQTTEDE